MDKVHTFKLPASDLILIADALAIISPEDEKAAIQAQNLEALFRGVAAWEDSTC